MDTNPKEKQERAATTTASDKEDDAYLRAAAGASFLAMNSYEDWASRINLETLDLSSACNCVLGQLYGDYGSGCGRLGLSGDVEHVRNLGFLPVAFEDGRLTAAWREVICNMNEAE
jgi:hypothetical protein